MSSLIGNGVNQVPTNGDLGTMAFQDKESVKIDAATLDSLVATTADINGGTIDGTAIGATTPSTGAFTTLSATGYTQSIAAKTANYTLISTNYTVTTSGNITITLPAAASHTGRLFVIKKADSNATATTVDGTSTETIDGQLSYTLTAQYESITVQSDGTQWLII